jgi:hypothetical protein
MSSGRTSQIFSLVIFLWSLISASFAEADTPVKEYCMKDLCLYSDFFQMNAQSPGVLTVLDTKINGYKCLTDFSDSFIAPELASISKGGLQYSLALQPYVTPAGKVSYRVESIEYQLSPSWTPADVQGIADRMAARYPDLINVANRGKSSLYKPFYIAQVSDGEVYIGRKGGVLSLSIHLSDTAWKNRLRSIERVLPQCQKAKKPDL